MLINILKTDFEFKDERGWFVQLVHDGYKQFNVIYSKKDTIRGNHFHKKNMEAFYVVYGSFDLCVTKKDIMEKYHFSGGDFFEIKPGITHSFCYTDDTLIVSMYSKGVEEENGKKDIFNIS